MSVKWEIKISLLWVICAVAVTIILLIKPFSCDVTPSQIIPSQYTPVLDSLGYVQADPVSDPVLPDSVPIPDEIITSTTSGSGVWIPDKPVSAGDSVAVDLSEVTLADGSHWIHLLINGSEVIWQQLTYYQKPVEIDRSNWSAGLEVVIIPEFDIGAVAAYRLATVWNINAEAALAVDINETITDPPDWFAVQGRLSVPLWKSVEGSVGGGLHVTKDDICGHVASGITIRF